MRIDCDDEGKVFYFEAENRFRPQIIKSRDICFFDAFGDESTSTAGSGKVYGRTALHGIDDSLGTSTFANHTCKSADLDKPGGIGIHASAGGGTGTADGKSRRGGAGADKIDELPIKINGQFFTFIQ